MARWTIAFHAQLANPGCTAGQKGSQSNVELDKVVIFWPLIPDNFVVVSTAAICKNCSELAMYPAMCAGRQVPVSRTGLPCLEQKLTSCTATAANTLL
jgi:hypothetical protein